MSTRAFRALVVAIAFTRHAAAEETPSPAAAINSSPTTNGGGLLDVDMRALVAPADLRIAGPVPQPEAGLPIGNGRMGTLLWTTPTKLHLQINRVDVFGNNKDTESFPERHTDYCGGCAFVDLDCGGDVFTERLRQHLSCREGLATLQGPGVRVRALASMDRDVIALEVTDDRRDPARLGVTLRMLRPPLVKRMKHTAASHLDDVDNRIILRQEFQEGDYYCGSAVAIAVIGREVRIPPTGDSELALDIEPARGSFTILISSAASFDRNAKLVDEALALLDRAQASVAAATNVRERETKDPFADFLAANRAWWNNFWNRGFVQLHSDDGAADMVQQHYYYYLYLMASTSRGRYPTKFNGMLWTTGGDRRQWGTQYWGANQSCLYNALFPTNRLELLDPMFDMYTGMYEVCALAARQQWGSQGVFIPETVAFDGLAKLPEDIAAEMRGLYLARKPMAHASAEFLEFARTKQPHSSRWNWWESGRWRGDTWQPRQRVEAPFGAVTHIFSRGAKIAYQFWQRYEYAGEEAWLRMRAYPMLRGVAEFYRNFPNVKKGDDGKYHIHYVNSNESIRGARDTDEEIASMMAIFPTVIRASEILNVDADMRPVWQEFVDNLAPLPTSDHPDALAEWGNNDRGRRRAVGGVSDADSGNQRNAKSPSETPPTISGDAYWIRALPPTVAGNGLRRPDGNTMPMWFFDLATLENPDEQTMRIANNTLDGYGDRPGGVLSKVGVTHAMMGRAEAVRTSLRHQLTNPDRAPAMANRLDLREGPQATSAQRLGRAADTLHNALLQSVGAGPAQPPVIRVFPAWPKDWDAAFTLLARGNVLVTSSMKNGQIEFIALTPHIGGKCRVRNPWPNQEASLFRGDSQTPETLRGSLFEFDTSKDERILLKFPSLEGRSGAVAPRRPTSTSDPKSLERRR